MKIAYVTMQFPVPSETFASLDVNTLVDMGHEVEVYALRTPHRYHRQLIEQRGHDRVAIRHFRWKYLLSLFGASVTQPLETTRLIGWLFRCCYSSPKHLAKSLVLLPVVMWHFKLIRQNGHEVVHLFWGHYPSMLGYLVNKYLPQVKLTQFLGAHDLIVNYPGSFALAGKVSYVITHCHANIHSLRFAGVDPSKIKVVHRGIAISKQDYQCKKFDDLKAPVFLTAGRLIDAKGVDDVIAIFRRVVDKHPEAKLLIAGEGPSRNALEDLVKNEGLVGAVRFMGHVPQWQLFEEMSHAHFFLLMSGYASERLPNVVKEAMLRQCVVITTQTPGIGELINNEKSGFIVDVSDVNMAHDIIEKCLSRPRYALTIATRAYKTIRDNFDVRTSMMSYLSLWQSNQ